MSRREAALEYSQARMGEPDQQGQRTLIVWGPDPNSMSVSVVLHLPNAVTV